MAKGDIIRVGRIGFYHYGIDIGDGKVIHYNGEPYNKSSASIFKVPLEGFTKGSLVEIVNIPTESSVDEIVERAQSCLGEKEYNIFFNNCEHFAKYCRTGKKPFITMRPQILDNVEGDIFSNMKKNIPNEFKRESRNIFRLITNSKPILFIKALFSSKQK